MFLPPFLQSTYKIWNQKICFELKTDFSFITFKLSATTLKQAKVNTCLLIRYGKCKPFSRDFTPVLGFIYSSLEQKAETWQFITIDPT